MNPGDIWPQFISELRTDLFPLTRLQPYPGLEALSEKLLDILRQLTPALLSAAARDVAPEVKVVENRVHFVLPLGTDEEAPEFCFSFLVDGGNWAFQHVENIFLRLDHVGPLPASTFPDLSQAQKAWALDEIQVSEMVRLYRFLVAEKGREFAIDWFKDGPRYLAGVRAWMPFLPLPEAFIYYVCWDLSNLHASPITLEQLDGHTAVITGQLRYFELYRRAAHLEQQISFDDYRRLFEAFWQDRARHAGWNLRIDLRELRVSMIFTKLSDRRE